MANDVGLFSAEQACTLAHISQAQLRQWARSDFYKPEYSNRDRRAFGRIYSFRDVVALRTIGLLRNKYRIRLQALRRAGAWLSERHDTPWSSLRFRISGRGLYYIEPETGKAVALTGPIGQIAHPALIKLDHVAAQVQREVSGLKRRKKNQLGKVAHNRYVVSNAAVLSGTRIPTATVYRFHAAGFTDEQIISEFPRLTRKDIEAAVKYEQGQQHRRLAS
jgi:uncharacterized protein (DUF433 family)